MSFPGRSLGPSLLVPAFLLHLGAWFAMLAHGSAWFGGWGIAVEKVAGTVIVVGPLVAGLTATVYAQRQRTSLRTAVGASAHPVRGWWAPAGRVWVLSVANLVLLAAEVALLAVFLDLRVVARPLMIVPFCAVVLAGHVLIGVALGAVLPPRLAGAVAGAVSFGIFLLAVAGLAPDAFITGGATASLVGLEYRTGAIATLTGQALLVALGLAAVAGGGDRWPWYRVAIAGSGIVGAVLLARLDVGHPDLRFEPAAVPLTCAGSSPQVCVAAETPRILRSAATGMERYAHPLRVIGVKLPDRWEPSWRPGADRAIGELAFSDRGELGTRAGATDLIPHPTGEVWWRSGGRIDEVTPCSASPGTVAGFSEQGGRPAGRRPLVRVEGL